MNAKRTEIRNKVETLSKELESAVRDWIEPLTKWLVADVTVCTTSSSVRLALSSDETKTIDLVYYNRDRGVFKEGQFMTNIGAFGSFDVISKNDVEEYYKQVGNLLSNKAMLDFVRKGIKEYSENILGLLKEYRALCKEV